MVRFQKVSCTYENIYIVVLKIRTLVVLGKGKVSSPSEYCCPCLQEKTKKKNFAVWRNERLRRNGASGVWRMGWRIFPGNSGAILRRKVGWSNIRQVNRILVIDDIMIWSLLGVNVIENAPVEKIEKRGRKIVLNQESEYDKVRKKSSFRPL